SAAPVEANVGEAGEQADEEDQVPLSNDMDFNLDGMNLDVEVPNTMPRPAPAEPTAELASIDFDFLDTQAKHDEPSVPGLLAAGAADAQDEAQDGEPNVMPDAEVVSSLDALELALNEMSAQVPSVAPPPAESSAADLSLDLSQFGLEATPDDAQPEDGALAAADAHADLGSEGPASDFDLSGISLELDSPPSVEPQQEVVGAGEEGYGASEMATKLDLAIAYQEIGDKEGARELLDEVLKGGTPEQSEKAKSLLLELA
ncbi:MAG TPA: FimV/HubP family polar landmark protein, partial [Noviherbaspirillum sp.]